MARKRKKKPNLRPRVVVPMNMSTRSWDRRDKRLKTRAARFRKALAEEGSE